jgi:ribosome biogenesis GTPase / thiamine phosphate phosphatase
LSDSLSPLEGIIIRSTGSYSTVRDSEGDFYECRLKGRFRMEGIKTTNPLSVGDRVTIFPERDKNKGIITAIHPRANYIIREATRLSKVSHIIASNIDRLFVITSIIQPRTSTGFIDRVLVTAEAYHIPAAVVFNKIDISDTASKTLMDQLMELYSGLGYGVFAVSAITGKGLGILNQALAGKVNLFTGHSGVGKSALINAIEPGLNIKTGDISAYHSKGKHTTTFAEMHCLTFGGYIIDTPGIKEFGLIDFARQEISERFPEMRERMHDCRFANCTHVHEPGCAIKQAIDEGKINAGRYRNYLGMLNDDKLDATDYKD